MDSPPRSPKQQLFSAALVRRILFLGGVEALVVTSIFFWHISTAGTGFDAFTSDNPVYRHALTMAQAAIVTSQIFVGLAVRSDRQSILRVGLLSNPRYLIAQGISVLIMCAVSYMPALQALFNTVPLSLADWVLLVVLGSLVLVADEIRKVVQRQRDRHREATT